MGAWRPKHVEWPYRNKTCTVLHPVGVSFYLLLTYSIQRSPLWEANRFSGSQEIPHISRNPKVHYPIHKSPPPAPILSQLDPVHTLTSHFLKSQLNIILPSKPGSTKRSLSLRFPHQNAVHASSLSPSYVLHAPPISFLSLSPAQYWVRITDTSAPHYAVSSTHLLPHSSWAQIFSSTPYSQTPSACVPPSVSVTKFHTHAEQQAELPFCIS